MAVALKKYSKYLKKKLAMEEILDDLKPLALRELKRSKDGQAIVDDVEYHLTEKSTTSYPDEVNHKIQTLREEARNSGKCKIKSREAFDAYLPKSSKETVLAKITDYKNYFGK
jgi:hypothetical protein